MRFERQVRVPVPTAARADEVTFIDGDLTVRDYNKGLVVLAHGGAHDRRSPSTRYIAEMLQDHELMTLQLDLLTPAEEAVDRRLANMRFDLDLLAARLARAMVWARDGLGRDVPAGYFGTGTAAAAALIAAADDPDEITAVVSRNGTPDLAGDRLASVEAPTLLIVDGADPTAFHLNRLAQSRMRCRTELEVLSDDTPDGEVGSHDPIDAAARLAAWWFATTFAAVGTAAPG